MEKVLFTLGRPHNPETFGADLLKTAATELAALGARGTQVNLVDEAVAPAAGLRIEAADTGAAVPDAAVGCWLDRSHDDARGSIDDALGALATEVHAYLVTESVPLDLPDPLGERTPGFSQLAFLRRRPDLDPSEWMRIWFDDHTQLALDTQDTNLYVQHVIVRALTDGAPDWHGIVEEGFPSGAMTDPAVFFDAVGDPDRLAANQGDMFTSVQRFLDLSAIQVIPTSRHVVSRLS